MFIRLLLFIMSLYGGIIFSMQMQYEPESLKQLVLRTVINSPDIWQKAQNKLSQDLKEILKDSLMIVHADKIVHAEKWVRKKNGGTKSGLIVKGGTLLHKYQTNGLLNNMMQNDIDLYDVIHDPHNPDRLVVIGFRKMLLYDSPQDRNPYDIGADIGYDKGPRCADFDPHTKNRIAIGCERSKIIIWDLENKQPLCVFKTSLWHFPILHSVNSVAYDPFYENELAVALSSNTGISIHDPQTGNLVKKLIWKNGAYVTNILSIAYDPFSINRLAAYSCDGVLILWHTKLNMHSESLVAGRAGSEGKCFYSLECPHRVFAEDSENVTIFDIPDESFECCINQIEKLEKEQKVVPLSTKPPVYDSCIKYIKNNPFACVVATGMFAIAAYSAMKYLTRH